MIYNNTIYSFPLQNHYYRRLLRAPACSAFRRASWKSAYYRSSSVVCAKGLYCSFFFLKLIGLLCILLDFDILGSRSTVTGAYFDVGFETGCYGTTCLRLNCYVIDDYKIELQSSVGVLVSRENSCDTGSGEHTMRLGGTI